MLDCLQLLHFHPGSQLHDIRRVKDAGNELAHSTPSSQRLGAGIEYIDVGGGLGVDYDGTAPTSSRRRTTRCASTRTTSSTARERLQCARARRTR